MVTLFLPFRVRHRYQRANIVTNERGGVKLTGVYPLE
jgi:hypothetical protein